jgi:PAS domain S-box-containing protein
VGRNYYELFVPESLRERTEEAMMLALNGEPVHGLETTVASGGGERVIRWAINRMIDPAGQVIGVMAIGNDTTGQINPVHSGKKRKSIHEKG